jgi:ribose transport system substrate-binding protein
MTSPLKTSRVLMLGLFISALALAGCSAKANSASSGSSSVNQPVAAGTDIAGAKAQLAKYSGSYVWKDPGPKFDTSAVAGKKVVYIPVDNQIPIFTVIFGEMKKALATAGAEATMCDGKSQPNQWAACINDAAGRGANVIILDSIPLTSVKTSVDKARAMGVKIIDGNNGDPGIVPEGADARVAFAYSLSGKLVSDWIIQDSGGHANVLIIQSPEVGNVPDLVGKGYVGELKAKCPSCTVKIIDVTISDWATKLQSTVQAQIAGDSAINYIIPIYDGMTTYVVPGVQAAGAQDRVKVASFNANLDPMKKMAAKKSMYVDVGSHNAYEGWALADQSMRLITGQKPLADELIPARVFTRENVGTLELTPATERSGVWFGDDTYKAKYKAIWGIS